MEALVLGIMQICKDERDEHDITCQSKSDESPCTDEGKANGLFIDNALPKKTASRGRIHKWATYNSQATDTINEWVDFPMCAET